MHVWGNKDLVTAVDAAHIASVFQQVASPDRFYTVSVVLGAAEPAAATRKQRRLQGGGSEPLVAPWTARLDDEEQIATFQGVTLQPLFEHGQLRSASCDVLEAEQVKLPIYFFVRGPRLTISSAEGLKVIRSFATVQFASIFGPEASAAICRASLHSVVQLSWTNPPSAGGVVSVAPQEVGGGDLAPPDVDVAGGVEPGTPVAQAAPLAPAGAAQDGSSSSSSSLSKGVSQKTRAILISIGVAGTILILFGAVKYAMAAAGGAGGGTGGGVLVVYPQNGGMTRSGSMRAHLHP